MHQLNQARHKKGRYPEVSCQYIDYRNWLTKSKAVFLVGGYGQNEYLLHRLEEKFKDFGVTVRRPTGTDG